MVYNPDKKYYVCGARNAWDAVLVGLFDNEEEAKNYDCIDNVIDEIAETIRHFGKK
mgnify:CR=1 FL=1